MKVVKRNGKEEEFDISKIKQVITWATEGLDVNPLELESHLSVVFKEGVKTEDIHKNSIIVANNLTSIEAPDWAIVAGRLRVMEYWKTLKRSRGYIYSLYSTVSKNCAAEVYDPEIINMYSKEDWKELNSYIDRNKDLHLTFTMAHTIMRRYLLPNENIQEMYMVIAAILANADEGTTNDVERAKEIYDVISDGKISLATPILMNLRRPNGNLTSCFILDTEDNLDSITDVMKEFAFISKNAGAAGVDLSKIRAHGSWIKHQKGAAGGVVPFIKVLNDISVYIDQMGKRAGSVTPALPVWHYDYLDFLDTQTEAGDQRKKAHDVFLQKIVPDEYMYRLKYNKDWIMFDPYEVKKKTGKDPSTAIGEEFSELYKEVEKLYDEGKLEIAKKMRARDVFKHTITTAMIKGIPYWSFKDTINEYNPAKDIGQIPCTNLCNESYSVVTEEYAHSCNLISIVSPRVDHDEEEYITKMAVDILDIVVDITTPPIERAAKHNEAFRVIGIGFLGFADWMAKNSLSYESEEAMEEVSNYFERFAIYALKATIERAKLLGNFPLYDRSEWAKGKLYGKSIAWYRENAAYPEEWEVLYEEQKKFGVRNLQLFAIAPNSSTGLVQGVTPSILPPWDVVYMDSSSLGNLLKMPLYIKDKQWYYKPYKYYSRTSMINFVSTVQKWIDSGISFEVVFDLNKDTIADIFNFYIDAWENNIKGIYYIRFIQPNGELQEKEESCTFCAN